MKWMCASRAPGGEDLALAGDGFGRRSDDDVDAGLDVGIAGLADAGDLAVLDADVGLDDAPVVDDQRIGDDRVDGAFAARELRLAHAVADDLAATEFHLLAIGGEVPLHLDDEVGIGKADLVAGGRAEHVGIGLAGNPVGHGSASPAASGGACGTAAMEPTQGSSECAMIGQTMKRTKGFAMTRLRVALAAMALSLVAALPAAAGSGNDRAIRDLETLRTVDRVVVIDVAQGSDRHIGAKRAHHSVQPLTPLQVAIAQNPALVEAINRTVWSFDLKSVYAAKVVGYTVYLYEGEPPLM